MKPVHFKVCIKVLLSDLITDDQEAIQKVACFKCIGSGFFGPVSPVVVNPSGPVGNGAPNGAREVQFVQITLQSLTKFPTGVLEWVTYYEVLIA